MKVPIEVILQDPTQPIPPTPDPTPITPVVPNTGAETMQTVADVTNGVSVGLVIIASLIFAVAIGALMLYLFHLYNHQKAVIEQNDDNKDNKQADKSLDKQAEIKHHEAKRAKAHKWSKGLFIASGATAVLAFAAFMGSFIFYSMIQPNSSSALEPTELNDSTYVTNNGTITITANLYNNEPVITGIKDTALVTTDATKGYELYLSMSDNSLDNKLYLDGDTTSPYYISPTTNGELTMNSWGYNLDGTSTYTELPLSTTPTLIKQGTEAVTEDPVDVYYSIKVDKSLPYGTYKGEIEYNVEPILIQDLSSITYMQDMTTEICNNTETPAAFLADGTTINADVPTKDLIDNRDGKSYTVSKLADGKCWMRQNLDLQKEDLLPGVALTNENTNNPAEGFELPGSQTSGSEDWSGGYPYTEAAINTPHLYDIPETVGEDGKTYTQKELGNLYNWVTATAGTGTYSTGKGEQASGSICPKGWRLPDVVMDHSEGWRIAQAEIKDFSELLRVYGAIYNVREEDGYVYYSYDENSSSRMYAAPLNLVRSGYYSSGVSNVGYFGYLWSSRANSTDGANSSSLYSTYVDPWSNGSKYYGYSVRCAAE